MKHLLIITTMLLTLVTSLAFAAAPQTAKAGKFTVALTTHPAPPTVGENHVTLTVSDGKKPVTGADVSLHLDMVGMSMPADVKATPGSEEGQYVATANLSMEGEWKLTATVNAMAGMTMAGDGKATFTVTAQQPAGGRTPANEPAPSTNLAGLPWPLILGAVVVVGIVVVIIVHGRPKQTPGA